MRYHLAICVLILCAAAQCALGDVLVSTYGQTADASYTMATSQTRYAVDFHSVSAHENLQAVFRAATQGTSSYQLFAELRSNNAGNPGSLLATFGPMTVPAGAAEADYTLNCNSFFGLGDNTVWLVAYPSSGGDTSGLLSLSAHNGQEFDSGVEYSTIGSTPAKVSTNGGSTWVSAGNTEFRYKFFGGFIPEPSGGAILLALMSLAFRHDNKLRKSRR